MRSWKQHIEAAKDRQARRGRPGLPASGCVAASANWRIEMEQHCAYELVSATYPAELTEAVNAHLASGWQLFGAPFAHGDAFYQAVIARGPTPDKRLRRTTGDGERG
jgi:hypothetical protein